VNAGEKYTFIQSLAFGFGSGLGFALALIINGEHPGET